jgi:hypothetical protein
MSFTAAERAAILETSRHTVAEHRIECAIDRRAREERERLARWRAQNPSSPPLTDEFTNVPERPLVTKRKARSFSLHYAVHDNARAVSPRTVERQVVAPNGNGSADAPDLGEILSAVGDGLNAIIDRIEALETEVAAMKANEAKALTTTKTFDTRLARIDTLRIRDAGAAKESHQGVQAELNALKLELRLLQVGLMKKEPQTVQNYFHLDVQRW